MHLAGACCGMSPHLLTPIRPKIRYNGEHHPDRTQENPMPENQASEKELLMTLRAALTIDAVGEVLDAMAELAQRYSARGLTEPAANILTYVMQHPDVRHDTFDFAAITFEDLEARICPRVIEDARLFVLSKSLKTVADYIFSQQAES